MVFLFLDQFSCRFLPAIGGSTESRSPGYLLAMLNNFISAIFRLPFGSSLSLRALSERSVASIGATSMPNKSYRAKVKSLPERRVLSQIVDRVDCNLVPPSAIELFAAAWLSTESVVHTEQFTEK